MYQQYRIISATMEEGINKDRTILQLTEQEQAKRLDFLFQNKILDIFVQECKTILENGGDITAISRKYALKYDLRQQFEEMYRVLQRTEVMLSIANSPNDGWKSLKIDDHCSLSIRTNHTLLELKSRGKIQCNLKYFLYLAYLIKLYTHCLPFCKQSQDIMQPTRLEKVGFIRLSIPIPFIKDRCTFLRGIGIDRLDKNGTVCIFAEGINQNKEYLQRNNIEIEKKMKGKELLDVKHFAVQLRYINQNETAYNGYALVDHHIPLLPQSLIAFVAKEIAKYLFNHLLKQLKNFDHSVWAKEKQSNFEDNREFYEWLDSKQEDLRRGSLQRSQ